MILNAPGFCPPNVLLYLELTTVPPCLYQSHLVQKKRQQHMSFDPPHWKTLFDVKELEDLVSVED